MNIINQIEDVDGEFKGDFHSEKTFKFVEQFLEKDKFLKPVKLPLSQEGTPPRIINNT